MCEMCFRRQKENLPNTGNAVTTIQPDLLSNTDASMLWFLGILRYVALDWDFQYPVLDASR